MSLYGKSVVTIPLGLTAPPAFGDVVTLLGMQKNPDKISVISEQAVVLGLKGEVVVLALPHTEAVRAAGYLPDRRLLILRGLSGCVPDHFPIRVEAR